MVRRERTTGLPRQRRREKQSRTERFHLSDNTGRLIVLGVGAALLAIVVFMFGASWYHTNYGHGRETVLRVGEEKFSLNYYAKRLGEYARQNPEASLGISQQQLLGTLENEGLAIELARELGVDLSDAAITARIAETLGVPPGGSGSSFDSAYRARLRADGVSDSYFRKKTKAQLAELRLKELFATRAEGPIETMQVRVAILSTKDIADSVVTRVKAGENLGTIAQNDSLDLASRGQDGLKDEQPLVLFPEGVRAAVEGKASGELLGPIQVDDQWWVFRVEKRNPEGSATDEQRTQIAAATLKDELQAKRANTTIRRSFDSGDADWATQNAF